MVTMSKLLDVLTNKSKMNVSQNKVADVFSSTPSSINVWIRKDVQPQLSAENVCEYIEKYRDKYKSNQDYNKFVNNIIEYLDIESSEKDALSIKFQMHKNNHPDIYEGYHSFLMELSQLALNRMMITATIPFDSSNPSRTIVGIGTEHVVAVRQDGRVFSTGANDYQQCNTHSWRDIVSVTAGWRSTLGLKKDGTCIAIGNNTVGNGELFRWNNINAVCAGVHHYLGLKTDGSVVSYGIAGYGQCNVSDWKYIKSLAAGTSHSVGLREDGTVIACGSNKEGQCEVSSWKNVIQIAASGEHTVALTKNGEILFAGNKFTFNFKNWNDVISIATGLYHVVGLKSDGTVLHTGQNACGLDAAYKWWDIKSIYAGYNTTVGIRYDGSVLITNDKYHRTYLDSSSWNIYVEPKTANNTESTFEKARNDAITTLEQINNLGLKLIPSLHSDSLDKEHSEIYDEIAQHSKNIWLSRNSILHIKPLADILLLYSSAFHDFSESFTFDKERNTYQISDTSYDNCISFLTVTKKIQGELREL